MKANLLVRPAIHMPRVKQLMAGTYRIISPMLMVLCLLACMVLNANAQAPTLSYSNPNVYVINAAITPLSPASSNVAPLAYGSPVNIGASMIQPDVVSVDAAGNAYSVSSAAAFVQIVHPDGTIEDRGTPNYAFTEAIDKAGNIYTVNLNATGDGYAIDLITPDGTTTQIIDFGPAYPEALAVYNGYIYIADASDATIEKAPVSGGTPVTIATGFLNPDGVAIDAAGNIYVADYEGRGTVKELAANTYAVTTVAGFNYGAAYSIAIDNAGAVYVGVPQYIIKMNPDGSNQQQLITGPEAPLGVAVDGKGVIYWADANASYIQEAAPTGGLFIDKILPAGLSFDATTGTISGTPTALSPATNYNVTAYNSGGGAAAIANIKVVSNNANLAGLALSAGTLNPGFDANTLAYNALVNNATKSIEITPATADSTASVTVSGAAVASGSASSPISLSPGDNSIPVVVTAGDNTTTKTYTITVTRVIPPTLSYSTPNVYVTNTAITPLSPASSNVAPLAYGSPVNIGASMIQPDVVSVDAAGNAYSVSSAAAFVQIVHPDGTIEDRGTPNYAFTEAIDKAGNIYTVNLNATEDGYAIDLITPDGTTTQIIDFGPAYPEALAVYNGYIYIADASDATIEKAPVSGGTPVTIATGFLNPDGVAIDAAGNIYVADFEGYGTVKELAANTYAVTTIASFNYGGAYGIAIDNAGAIYVGVSQYIIKMNPDGSNQQQLITGTETPLGVAMDGKGVIYWADANASYIQKAAPTGGLFIDKPLPGGLSFDATTGTISGTPTAVSPATNYNVTAYNFGGGTTSAANIAVTLPAPTTQAANVTFTNTTALTTTASWTNGNGTSRAVFMAAAATGVPAPAADSAYNANAAFSSGDQVGTTGWYCVYNGTGTSVDVTGLAPGTSYQTMVVEYNGTGNTSSYLYTPAAGNPANITTLIPTITVAGSLPALITGAGTASASATFSVSGTNLAAGITVTPPPGGGFEVSTDNLNFSGTVSVGAAGTVTSIPVYVRLAAIDAAGSYAGNIVLSSAGAASVNVAIPSSTVKSPDPALASLIPSNGALSPVFSSGTTSYNISVGNGLATMTITPTADDPNATITVQGKTVASGQPSQNLTLSVGSNNILIVVTASDAVTKETYTLNIKEAKSQNASLASLKPGSGTFSAPFSPAITTYTENVNNATATMSITPTAANANAAITVNGTPVTSGMPSQSYSLPQGGSTVITTIVTAQLGNTQTYVLTVNRALSGDASLSALTINAGTMVPGFEPRTQLDAYSAKVSSIINAIEVRPTATSANIQSIKVNTAAVNSGSPSGPITLSTATTAVTIVVTAQDGTQRTYTVTITRVINDASLSNLQVNTGTFTPKFEPQTALNTYTANEANGISSVNVTPTTTDPNATVTINTNTATSGQPTAIATGTGTNPVTITVTAADHSTTRTYNLTIKVAAPPADNTAYQPVSVEKPTDSPTLNNDGVTVHQAISPNGDGINDFLQIDNITNYPDNKLSIMNRSGQLIYEAKGYDNSSKTFDGHSNKNGQMQLPGTYFYQLDYAVNGITKHKTGFLVLKY